MKVQDLIHHADHFLIESSILVALLVNCWYFLTSNKPLICIVVTLGTNWPHIQLFRQTTQIFIQLVNFNLTNSPFSSSSFHFTCIVCAY
jgi:hypothetical protein